MFGWLPGCSGWLLGHFWNVGWLLRHCKNVWVVARMFCVAAKALFEWLGGCQDVLCGCYRALLEWLGGCQDVLASC